MQTQPKIGESENGECKRTEEKTKCVDDGGRNGVSVEESYELMGKAFSGGLVVWIETAKFEMNGLDKSIIEM